MTAARSKRAVLAAMALLPWLMGIGLLRASNRHVEQGNQKLQAGDAEAALQLYDKALKDDDIGDPEARAAAEFNRGTALAALNKHAEAAEAFLEATKSKEAGLRARAFYNLGNTFYRGEKYSEAVEAFKRSLVLDPGNSQAKWNLELARRQKQEQDKKNEQNQDKQNQDKQNQDKQNQDKQNQDKQNQDKQNQDKQNQDKQNQDNPDQKRDQDNQDQDKQNQEQDPATSPDDGKSKPEDQRDPAKPQDEDQQGSQGQTKPPQDEPTPEQQPNQQQQAPDSVTGKATEAPAQGGPDMKEINAILDSLEQSPHKIEQQQARIRAMRRQRPTKDW